MIDEHDEHMHEFRQHCLTPVCYINSKIDYHCNDLHVHAPTPKKNIVMLHSIATYYIS